MIAVCVKIRIKGDTNKYRKMLSTNEKIFAKVDDLVVSSVDYVPGALLAEGEWFKIEHASQQQYAIDIISEKFETVSYKTLTKVEFQNIDFLFVKDDTVIYFQNVTKSKLVSKKKLGSFGEGFQYQNNCKEIVVNDYPDAIYCSETDILYFRKLETIVGIFKGIDELYREATDSETEQFLKNDFIILKDNYGILNVKTANRKRIALAMKTLSQLNKEEKNSIVNYISEYCPRLKKEENAFEIGNEEELKMVLFGIEQRFYTTPIGNEKRIANSVVALNL